MLPLVSRKDYEKADIKVSDTSAIDLTQNLQYTTLSKDEYTTSISSSSWFANYNSKNRNTTINCADCNCCATFCFSSN